MNKRIRLIFLAISLLLLITIGKFITGNFGFLLDDFWFTSGFLLLILLSLIDQPHFSTDSNIFTNAVAAGVSLLLVDKNNRECIFWVFLLATAYLAISSYIILLLRQKTLKNESSSLQFFSRLNRNLGKPETLFSAFFLWGAIKQFGMNSNSFNMLLMYWVIFMVINIPELAKTFNQLFERNKEKQEKNAIGKIFGIQSKNTFLAKLVKERPQIKLFDFVEFVYSVGDSNVRKGLIFDTYLLNEEQWIKVLVTREIDDIFNNTPIFSYHTSDIVYKITDIPDTNYLDRFIGIITENSTIGKIRFIYNSKARINEGQLLEVSIRKQTVLYQIVEGITKIEQLDKKNQTGLIIGEALQLGTWNTKKFRFEQFGWVPNINSPIYTASKIKDIPIEGGELIIGSLPCTNYPVILNKEISITHHTAILGVTGTGKSVFTRNLIREFLKTDNIKIICVDFTLEYKNKLNDLNPVEIISKENQEKIFTGFEWISNELDKFQNNQDKKRIVKGNEFISKTLEDSLKTFLSNDSKITIFELPDISNSAGILEYTKQFFKALFKIAKGDKCYGNKVCVILEEAHTVIPEWNFLGISDRNSQSLVNSISQIALQGRKYDIGFIVVAQRTANVSKTVLTQCNSIISFQEFDKTSSDFLSNYFGKEIVNLLPNLKFRQAIAAGKAFKSNVPMVFEVPEIIEEK